MLNSILSACTSKSNYHQEAGLASGTDVSPDLEELPIQGRKWTIGLNYFRGEISPETVARAEKVLRHRDPASYESQSHPWRMAGVDAKSVAPGDGGFVAGRMTFRSKVVGRNGRIEGAQVT